MSGRSIFPKIQIIIIGLFLHTQFMDPVQKLVIVVFTLGATDDLSNTRNQTIHCCNGLIVRVQFHIEGLDFLRIIGNEDRTLEDLLGQITLMLGLKVTAPENLIVKFVIMLLELLDSIGISDAAEIGRSNMLQAVQKALINKLVKELHFFRSIL